MKKEQASARRYTHICRKCDQKLTEKTRKGHAQLLGHGAFIQAIRGPSKP